MTKQRAYDPRNKAQVVKALRQEILAARLKVTLDEQLGRTTPYEVKRLSQMKPPAVGSGSTEVPGDKEQGYPKSRSASSGWAAPRPPDRAAGTDGGQHIRSSSGHGPPGD